MASKGRHGSAACSFGCARAAARCVAVVSPSPTIVCLGHRRADLRAAQRAAAGMSVKGRGEEKKSEARVLRSRLLAGFDPPKLKVSRPMHLNG